MAGKPFARQGARTDIKAKLPECSGQARDIAATVAGVSARYVQDAKFVARHSPLLIEDVHCGRMTIPEAKKEAVRLSGVSGNGKTGEPPTHRVELDLLGQRLRSLTLTEEEATKLAEALAGRIARGGR